ncbi:EthD domain-containing protein [Nocardia sp. BMG51109]|uniref:EthD domain-containing protein n=1 Tax=Nocardia sp. BMG51109 TaxID=1056816 RepID=UPI000466DCA5|nr:EthD domain-containing protein [Nocardia sp. BMG51109]
MTKVMYALWGSGLDKALHAPTLHARLSAAGAETLQLNICDDDVAAARLRLSTYEEPIAAIVGVWTDGANGPVTEALATVADRVDGWIVDERVPLPPPPAENGARHEALANVALLRVPADQTRDQWLRYWHDTHTQVAIDTQATIGYVQNAVTAALTPGARVDGLVEELFPMAAMTDQHAFWGSAGDDAELQRRVARMLSSISAFGADRDIDVVPTSRYRYRLT